jgi:hypothetical protein
MVAGNIGGTSVRLILIAAVGAACCGVAQAQTTYDAYGRPKALNPLPPIGSVAPIPNMPTPAPFRPYQPPTYLRPNPPSSPSDPYPHIRHTPGMITPGQATPEDPYPSLHPHRKHESF